MKEFRVYKSKNIIILSDISWDITERFN